MWLGKRAVLHVFDTQKHFGMAAFLKDQSIEDVWKSLTCCWASIYTGYAEKRKVDQEIAFNSFKWKRLCDEVDTDFKTSVFESQNSLRNKERYHEPDRKIFMKILHKNPSRD